MTEEEIRNRAFAMPFTNPAYPPGPYQFVNREYLVITYRTDPERLRAIVPEPLALDAPLVKYEFIRMPNSTGFGDYIESGQVIPVSLNGRRGNYTHCMFLDDESAIAGGREIWGFPKKLASPSLKIEKDTLVGTLDYGPVRVATGTMGYKHRTLNASQIEIALGAPNFLIKVIPHVDGTARICELVEYQLEDIEVRGAWAGPGSLQLNPHALAPVAELPVLEVVSAVHFVADLTLGLGKVVHDYLRRSRRARLKGGWHASPRQGRSRHWCRKRHWQGNRARVSARRRQGRDSRPQPGRRRRGGCRAWRKRCDRRRDGRNERSRGRGRHGQGSLRLRPHRRAREQCRHPDRGADWRSSTSRNGSGCSQSISTALSSPRGRR